MKIAFDVDGVITDMPELFSVITKSLKTAGHEVIIISDYDEYFRAQREEELKNYGIEHDQFIITGDKEEYCQKEGIKYAIDDKSEHFPNSQFIQIGAFLIGDAKGR